MTDRVKPKRRYRSPRRAAQAKETQQAILDVAGKLFVATGWSRTTIAAIAEAASVSKETIYAVFGNKRAILQRLISDAIRGSTPDLPLLEQPGPREIKADKDFMSIVTDLTPDALTQLQVITGKKAKEE